LPVTTAWLAREIGEAIADRFGVVDSWGNHFRGDGEAAVTFREDDGD